MAFVIGSYQAVEHPGGGHRASTDGLWCGEDLRTFSDVAMTVLTVECAEDARSEVDAVAAIRHPHLLPVIDLVQDADRVAVVCPWPAGGRLAELVRRRGRLSAQETLTVLIPLASAVVEMHAAGIGHGGICPETIWFDAHGRPLLGAPAVSRLIANLNGGLPAGIRDVAPEVVRGEKEAGDTDDAPGDRSADRGSAAGRPPITPVPISPVPITPEGDVFSLASVALFCLTGRSAWAADDPADVLVQSAIGQLPDPPDDAGPAELIDLVRDMLRLKPAGRPSANEVSERLARCGDPTPIVFSSGPTPTPASADRWRGWSATPSAEAPADVDVSANADKPAAGRPESVRRGRSGVARRRSTPLARVGLVLLGGLLVTVIAVQVDAWWSGRAQPGLPPIGAAVGAAASSAISGGSVAGLGPLLDPAAAEPAAMGSVAEVAPSWADVVVGLDSARGRALDAADPELLSAVYLDSTSGAGAADVAVITQLADQGLRVVDGVHQIVSVSLADSAPSGPPPAEPSINDQVRLAVVDTLPPHPVVDAAGRQVGLTEARAEQRRILVLSATDAGYRISSIEAG